MSALEPYTGTHGRNVGRAKVNTIVSEIRSNLVTVNVGSACRPTYFEIYKAKHYPSSDSKSDDENVKQVQPHNVVPRNSRWNTSANRACKRRTADKPSANTGSDNDRFSNRPR